MMRFWFRLVDWWTTDPHWRAMFAGNFSRMGLAALSVALEEVGRGETVRNNEGPDLDRYRGPGAKGPWCAAFVFYSILIGCRRMERDCPIKRSHSARTLFARVVKAGMLVESDDIRAGDIVLWSRGDNPAFGHIGIVSEVHRGWPSVGAEKQILGWSYCAGNEGPFPAKVAIHDGTARRKPIGFARLP